MIKEMNLEMLSVLSKVLVYPQDEKFDVSEYREVESLFSEEKRKTIDGFFAEMETKSIEEQRELYVNTFDFGKKSLHMSYYLCDDVRRGTVLHRLKLMYEFCGFEVEAEELPDYLPLMLEFLVNADLANMESDIFTFVTSVVREGTTQLNRALLEEQNQYAIITSAVLDCF